MKALFRSLVVALLCVTASIASAQTLRIALGDPFQTIDPHFDASNANEGAMLHVYDALTKLDEGSRVTPGLAESWRLVDEQTWEFKLRHGVKFHNGEEFTAEDVAFTTASARYRTRLLPIRRSPPSSSASKSLIVIQCDSRPMAFIRCCIPTLPWLAC